MHHAFPSNGIDRFERCAPLTFHLREGTLLVWIQHSMLCFSFSKTRKNMLSDVVEFSFNVTLYSYGQPSRAERRYRRLVTVDDAGKTGRGLTVQESCPAGVELSGTDHDIVNCPLLEMICARDLRHRCCTEIL